MPRMPEDLAAFEAKFLPQSSADLPKITRHWQLTNTRYLLGAAGFLDVLNRQFDPVQRRFRILDRFNIVPKPEVAHPSKLEDLTAVPDTNGPFAVFELNGALPRANLYSKWQVVTNDQLALDQLVTPEFDPEQTLLVAGGVAEPKQTATNTGPTQVTITTYSPKDIQLSATTTAPSVLLLNDRFDPNWKVFVDGRPKPVLRCNYIMQGVELAPGQHRIEFKFLQPMGTFYVSVAGVVLAAALSVFLLLPQTTRAE